MSIPQLLFPGHVEILRRHHQTTTQHYSFGACKKEWNFPKVLKEKIFENLKLYSGRLWRLKAHFVSPLANFGETILCGILCYFNILFKDGVQKSPLGRPIPIGQFQHSFDLIFYLIVRDCTVVHCRAACPIVISSHFTSSSFQCEGPRNSPQLTSEYYDSPYHLIFPCSKHKSFGELFCSSH